jgi:hypothetical protein
MKNQDIDLSPLAEKWPSAVVERQQLKEFSGGALNARTMANHDSKGQGIKGRIIMGRKVLYPVNEVIAWMEARASLPKKGKVGQGGGRA